jgi:hypothetical protein
MDVNEGALQTLHHCVDIVVQDPHHGADSGQQDDGRHYSAVHDEEEYQEWSHFDVWMDASGSKNLQNVVSGV